MRTFPIQCPHQHPIGNSTVGLSDVDVVGISMESVWGLVGKHAHKGRVTHNPIDRVDLQGNGI